MGKMRTVNKFLIPLILAVLVLCACGRKQVSADNNKESAEAINTSEKDSSDKNTDGISVDAEADGAEAVTEPGSEEAAAGSTESAAQAGPEEAAAGSTESAAQAGPEEAAADSTESAAQAGSEETAVSADGSEEPDYSLPENWAYWGIGEDKDADLFIICPTVDMKDEYNMSMEDTETKESFVGALNMERGIYEDNTRMYAPFYRQAAMKVYGLDREEWEQYLEIGYRDVAEAFEYYLENENKGRPIILAGFSQGGDFCYRLLRDYFGDEALYDQLVAVYALGWPCTEDMTKECPQIIPARSADDVGTVITFDCEAPEITETFINPAGQKTFSINPLNWKTDSTPADKSENLGACFTNYKGEIRSEAAGFCGCYIDDERGILKVTDINAEDYKAVVPGLSNGAYHIYDYQFFFRNLQENVKERIRSFEESVEIPSEPEEADELQPAA